MNAVTRIRGLREALDHLATLLVTPNPDALLDSESRLRMLLTDLPTGPFTPADKEAAERELTEARDALTRCRQLGASLTAIVRCSFDARGEHVGYGPNAADRLLPRSISARG